MNELDHEATVTFRCSQPTNQDDFPLIQKDIKDFNRSYSELASKHKGFWIDQGWLTKNDNKHKCSVLEYDIVFSFVSRQGMLDFKEAAEQINNDNVSIKLL